MRCGTGGAVHFLYFVVDEKWGPTASRMRGDSEFARCAAWLARLGAFERVVEFEADFELKTASKGRSARRKSAWYTEMDEGLSGGIGER
jgi:hypothetical protein